MNGIQLHKRWALLIGINQYPNLAPRYQLNGCVNDVNLIKKLLIENFGFPDGNITQMYNEQATRDVILTGLDTLVTSIGNDDLVVLYYSGHGSRMIDREGDEPDGWDETIVAYDSGRGSYPNRDITDDEIYIRLDQLAQKTSYITLIFDCCHSGHITRDPFSAGERWVESDDRLDQLPPPCALTPQIRAELHGDTRDIGPSTWFPLGDRHVLIAGCHSNESSFEHRVEEVSGTITHGALTYFLSRELAVAQAGTTYYDVFERASANVTATYPRQHPQLEGQWDRALFGVQNIQPIRFFPVQKREGQKVVLGAGAAHGMTVGSQWGIYPSGIKAIIDQTLRLGCVEITDVHAITSEATLKEEIVADRIAIGTRAVEEKHNYGPMRLTVDVLAPPGYENIADFLRSQIQQEALLDAPAQGEVADVRAYIILPREQTHETDLLPQFAPVTNTTWAVVGQDGRLLFPLRPVGNSEAEVRNAVSMVIDNLMKLGRYRLTLALTNPSPAHLLKGKMEFNLKRRSPEGELFPIVPAFAGGYSVLEEGDIVALEIQNNHDAEVYVAVFDFGLTGKVSLLYPGRGANKMLAPGKSIIVGERLHDAFQLRIPKELALVSNSPDVSPNGGTETFKLFATLSPTDFSVFEQASYRDIDDLGSEQHSPLNRLLLLSLTGIGTREAMPVQVSEDEEWTTVERSFFLQQKIQSGVAVS